MLLKLYGSSGSRLINLNRDFFSKTEIGYKKSKNFITPSEKATQMGLDLYGRSYRGHILEKDGEIVSNTLENREVKLGLESCNLDNDDSRTARLGGRIKLASKILQGLK